MPQDGALEKPADASWRRPGQRAGEIESASPGLANLLRASARRHAGTMSKRSLHTITETRDWSRILLSFSVGIAVIILAAQGDLTAAVVTAAGALIR